LHKLRQELEGLDRKRPVAVHCKSGYRSSIGTSILKASGFEQVMNVVGGFDAWVAQGLPVASGSGKPCPKS
jgi:hydroxyacylglutathione hydrolase